MYRTFITAASLCLSVSSVCFSEAFFETDPEGITYFVPDECEDSEVSVSLDQLKSLDPDTRGLNISRENLSIETLKGVVSHFSSLETLMVSDNSLQDEDMPLITGITTLKELDICYNPFTAKSIGNLASLEHLRVLKARSLSLENHGIKILCSAMPSSLEILDVTGCDFDGRALTFFQTLQGLKELHIGAGMSLDHDDVHGFQEWADQNKIKLVVTNLGSL
tara:strand:- start:2263 stop:2925 length:663 start_codon:yes stop_codon:yes gene_type:complete